MKDTAKLFMNGRSQAVRLPAKFRFDTDCVFIRQDKKTGDIILSKKPDSWEDFFQKFKPGGIDTAFMAERDNFVEKERRLF